MDHDTGRSKGYGFVSMGSASHAAAAVGALDNYMFPGAAKPMSVKIADSNRQAGARPSPFPGNLLASRDMNRLRWLGEAGTPSFL